MSVNSAYRRLAIVILELDVPTLTAKLASQSECFDARAERTGDSERTSTTPIVRAQRGIGGSARSSHAMTSNAA